MSSRLLLVLAAVLGLGFGHAVTAQERRPPNVIVILVDDLGWSDLGCYGSTFHHTPHLDRLAREGVRFTDAYSACTVCSPTRAALLTGKHPARLHVTDWIAGHPRPKARLRPPNWSLRLPEGEATLASVFKGAGYQTALVGKWHLGGTNSRPQDFGFDVNLGGDHRGQPPSYFSPYGLPQLSDGPKGEFLTDRESAEAIRFIEENRDRPFFLYLPHYAVHTPLMGKPDVVERYRGQADPGAPQRNPTYAALLESVDDSVGRIRQRLDELKLATNTVLVFTSDNGGLVQGGTNAPTRNIGLRSGKGDAYEGGVRVPLIIAGSGVAKPGTTVSWAVQTPDLYPTLLELTGVPDAGGHGVDGVSLAPLLRGQPAPGGRPLFWHYPHYHPGGATPYGAIREGEFKLLEFYESGHLELYHLPSDLSEHRNLANALPEVANGLAAKLAAWRKSVGAQMPEPNPDAQPEPISPGPDGSLVLPAHRVVIHGTTVRYEPPAHKDTVGYWVKPEDWVSWDVTLPAPGRYRVEILQGCGTGSGGSQVEASLGGAALTFTVMETGGFQRFQRRDLGVLQVDQSGPTQFALKPRRKPGAAVMDVREVVLRRVR